MAKDPPERVTFSIPSDSDLSQQEIERLVAQSDCESVSEWVRKVILSESDE